MELKKQNVFFLDLQTTGAKPESAHILEMAWSSLHSEEIHSYTIKLPDGELIPRRIQFITGISDKSMLESKSLSEVLNLFKEFLGSYLDVRPLVIIHFAQFEKPFLMAAFGASEPQKLPFDILCTHQIAKRLFPNLPTRGIKGLAGYFGCPSGDLKRARSHVHATQVIWQGLLPNLEDVNLKGFPEILRWLNETPKATRGKYEYPLAKEKRLALPKQPGVYRMLSRWGEILYVGKATSLHDRVNSYFRGQKNRDSKKLEMLTQVWDLQVTPLASPLEAALLETDEIKKWNPPYNISLKVGRRELAFFNRDFTSVRNLADTEHVQGPFSNILVLDSIRRLSQSIKSENFDESMFYEPLPAAKLKTAFEVFCSRHGLHPQKFQSVRSILAVGLHWYRKIKDQELSEEIEDNEEDQTKEISPEELADKFERHFTRGGANYWRSKKLTRLLNSTISVAPPENTQLVIQNGSITRSSSSSNLKKQIPWLGLDIETYDRMTVLWSELQKIKSKGVKIEIHYTKSTPVHSSCQRSEYIL